MKTATERILLLDGNRGIYVPQHFRQLCLSGAVNLRGNDVLRDEMSDLESPDNDLYWDSWETILAESVINLPEYGDQKFTLEQTQLIS